MSFGRFWRAKSWPAIILITMDMMIQLVSYQQIIPTNNLLNLEIDVVKIIMIPYSDICLLSTITWSSPSLSTCKHQWPSQRVRFSPRHRAPRPPRPRHQRSSPRSPACRCQCRGPELAYHHLLQLPAQRPLLVLRQAEVQGVVNCRLVFER